MNQLVFAWGLSLLVLAGCAGTPPSHPPPNVRASAVALSTAQTAQSSAAGTGGSSIVGLPGGCTPEGAAHLLEGFLTAFNDGDPERLAGYFGSQFKWFSDATVRAGDASPGFLAYDPRRSGLVFPAGSSVGRVGDQEALLPYLRERHAAGERLHLAAVSVGPPSWHGSADILFRLTRQAPYEPPVPDEGRFTVGGKGVINCATQEIEVWSMGQEATPVGAPERGLALICPQVAPDPARTEVIACQWPPW
jgi:hypothetical protein